MGFAEIGSDVVALVTDLDVRHKSVVVEILDEVAADEADSSKNKHAGCAGIKWGVRHGD